jgi:hypothetical protein
MTATGGTYAWTTQLRPARHASTADAHSAVAARLPSGTGVLDIGPSRRQSARSDPPGEWSSTKTE